MTAHDYSGQRTSRRGGIAFVAVAAALLAGACEGSNVFEEEPISTARPLVTRLIMPSVRPLGSDVAIEVRALAERGLRDVRLEYSGLIVDEETVSVDGSPTDTVVVTRTILLPGTAVDTLLIVRATATDVAGRVSLPVLDTVFATRTLGPAAGGRTP